MIVKLCCHNASNAAFPRLSNRIKEKNKAEMEKSMMLQNLKGTKYFLMSLLFVALAILTACNHEDEMTLTSTSWKLYGYVNTTNGNIRVQELDYPADQYSIYFSENGTITGRSRIHEMKGYYQISGNSIWIAASVITNGDKGGHGDDVYSIERAFLNSLAKSTFYEIKDGWLRLYYNSGKEYLLFDRPGGNTTDVTVSDSKVVQTNTGPIRAEDCSQEVHVNDVLTIHSVAPSTFLYVMSTYSEYEPLSSVYNPTAFHSGGLSWLETIQTNDTTFIFKIHEPNKWDSLRYINADFVATREFGRSTVTFHLTSSGTDDH